jgi:histidinol-phosphate/aromatic aminotransferase/cobyric acid decarboxylase-like protein
VALDAGRREVTLGPLDDLARELLVPGHPLGVAVGDAHLRAVLAEYQMHYNTARPHQGIAQRVPDHEHHAPRATVTDVDTQQIRRRSVSGLINEYSHAA